MITRNTTYLYCFYFLFITYANKVTLFLDLYDFQSWAATSFAWVITKKITLFGFFPRETCSTIVSHFRSVYFVTQMHLNLNFFFFFKFISDNTNSLKSVCAGTLNVVILNDISTMCSHFEQQVSKAVAPHAQHVRPHPGHRVQRRYDQVGLVNGQPGEQHGWVRSANAQPKQ